MGMCSSDQSGAATPPPAAPAAAPAPAGAPETNSIPLPQVHKGSDGTVLNGPQTGGWRDAINPIVRGMMPGGVQAVLGAAGMPGMPTVGNKQTDVQSGMISPAVTASLPPMKDPGQQKNSQGGGRLGSL